ncbi:hypothetical protein LCGC14_1940330 [marine sediment metagenome]|uniref:Uncharacterized protein n=1 Tax=marine sediment metagenome TaxID=412755 RepID=A0A0F9FKS9_9ZZZZ
MAIRYAVYRVDERDTSRNPIKEETRIKVADIKNLCVYEFECKRCIYPECRKHTRKNSFYLDIIRLDIAIEDLEARLRR